MGTKQRRGPVPLRQVMKRQRGDLASLQRRTRLLEDATAELGRSLPARMAGHWQVAALTRAALVISVESPVWATVLRGHQRDLLNAAASLLGSRPAQLQIRVAAARQTRHRSAGHRLSPDSARILEETAGAIDHPALADALRRLARHRAK
ncbi:DUF721 domain-containing protein [Spiribacter sp. 2438]|uniref:DciA family protein n=1 Tax=Spiribacter sp. 2438 TaxID=2666185 RepID=UPI0012AEE4DC|nr:DciA family protein [Spiribacter sp. 2438]QGM22145.1 DUF721 domain-containing protein [Spiribacter sp. 2438]